MVFGMLELVCCMVAISILVYYYLTSTFDHWKIRGVVGPTPVPGFGNGKEVLLGRESFGDFLKRIYDDYKNEPLVGVFLRREPFLIINDPDIVKDVLIKDFTSFPQRHMDVYEKVEPLSQHLFGLDAVRWRPLRPKLSPVFTSGKLKEMFHLLLECSEQYERYLDELIDKGETIECRELAAKFTTDVIGSCAFGIDMNALGEEDSKFREMGRKTFEQTWSSFIRNRLRAAWPSLYQYIGHFFNDGEVTEFFTKITKEAMEYRKRNNVKRRDVIDSLVDLKDNPGKLGTNELTDYFLAAQAFVFFVAGFETSSTTISNALYEMALNPSLQDKVREDVKNVLKTNGGKLTYESVKEMKYLDAFFLETLRKYPSVMFLARKALTDYTFKGTKVSVPKYQRVFIPVYGFHLDPEIYPNPEVFDPERFYNPEIVKARHPMHYLPFGDGPRNCIGARFAVYQVKIGLIKVVLNHKIEVCKDTQIPYINNPRQMLFLQPNHDLHLKITKINEK